MFQNLELQGKYIQEKFPQSCHLNPIENDNLIIYIKPKLIEEFLSFLKNDSMLSFKVLLDVFGVDLLTLNCRNNFNQVMRFEVVYNLLSLKLNNRITVKIALEENSSLNSVSSIFPTANWLEREIFDMYGIAFNNHPDLRRILTDYNFEGHPLRKDFPLTGYKEVRYDNDKKAVIYEDVNLMQEYRNFDFEMPWIGPKYLNNKN